MKMHERIRKKVCLTYSSDKSWKGSILCIRFVENVDLVAFSKGFLLLNNRKQTMRTKKVCPKLSDLEIWYEVSACRSNQLAKSHWKHICWTLNVSSKRPRKDMELTALLKSHFDMSAILWIYCIFSKRLSLVTPLVGCFGKFRN